MKSAKGATSVSASQLPAGRGAEAGSGAEQGGEPAQRHQRGHHGEACLPAEARSQIQRAGAGRDQAEAIADLGHRGAGALFGRVQQFDAIGVDDDILAGRQEGHDHGPEGSAVQIDGRIAGAEPKQCADQPELDQRQPGAAPAEQPAQQRDRQPVDQRRPEEFERVGQADQAEQPDIGEAEMRLGQPDLERAARQQERQPAGKPHQQHDQDARLQIDSQRSRGARLAAGRRIGGNLCAGAQD